VQARDPLSRFAATTLFVVLVRKPGSLSVNNFRLRALRHWRTPPLPHLRCYHTGHCKVLFHPMPHPHGSRRYEVLDEMPLELKVFDQMAQCTIANVVYESVFLQGFQMSCYYFSEMLINFQFGKFLPLHIAKVMSNFSVNFGVTNYFSSKMSGHHNKSATCSTSFSSQEQNITLQKGGPQFVSCDEATTSATDSNGTTSATNGNVRTDTKTRSKPTVMMSTKYIPVVLSLLGRRMLHRPMVDNEHIFFEALFRSTKQT
jgi:hypothetical protein